VNLGTSRRSYCQCFDVDVDSGGASLNEPKSGMRLVLYHTWSSNRGFTRTHEDLSKESSRCWTKRLRQGECFTPVLEPRADIHNNVT
jgi:hypothetical protein